MHSKLQVLEIDTAENAPPVKQVVDLRRLSDDEFEVYAGLVRKLAGEPQVIDVSPKSGAAMSEDLRTLRQDPEVDE